MLCQWTNFWWSVAGRLARLASRRLLVQAHGFVTMRIFPTHSQRPVLTMVTSTTSPQVWLKWGLVNAYPTVVGMNVHLPALSSFTRVQTGSTMGLLWYGQLQVPRIHGFIMASYHFPIKITFWGICHYLPFSCISRFWTNPNRILLVIVISHYNIL